METMKEPTRYTTLHTSDVAVKAGIGNETDSYWIQVGEELTVFFSREQAASIVAEFGKRLRHVGPPAKSVAGEGESS